jgi:hypothetical protein
MLEERFSRHNPSVAAVFSYVQFSRPVLGPSLIEIINISCRYQWVRKGRILTSVRGTRRSKACHFGTRYLLGTSRGRSLHHPRQPQPSRVKKSSSTPTGPSQAPDFQQVRSYLRTTSQREALGGFIKAGWSPAELGEFARQVFLAPGKTYPTAASYQYAMDKGADHPFAQGTLASLRKRGATLPDFDRPMPKEYEWDDPDNPEHTPELRAEIEEMGRLWRNREASWREEPWPTEYQPIPRTLWKRLFRIRIRYHSLENTLQFEGLRGYSQPYTEDTRGITSSRIGNTA